MFEFSLLIKNNKERKIGTNQSKLCVRVTCLLESWKTTQDLKLIGKGTFVPVHNIRWQEP